MDDKIIVTNSTALIRKYSSKGLAAVKKSLKLLVAADKKRGIKTRVVFLDDVATMKKYGGTAVTNSASPKQNKDAIDAIFKALTPDYLMILGAGDVVPLQDLKNPVFGVDDDDDKFAWGDLPYACDNAYSRDPAKFVGPTRVVGRLPDLRGASEPSYLIGLLDKSANYSSRPASDYNGYFGLSAAVWKGSTVLSLENIFGQADKLMLAPPSGPNYPNHQLRARSHFINCHGGPSSPEFQGQKGNSFPVSLTSSATSGEIVEGTIAAVECCYGAEMYDSVTLGIDIPICQSYLKQGAYGYLGSSTIAYGPANENGAADFICQYFLQKVLEGASIGSAALQARQMYVQNCAELDPIDLKTLAQFYLLGDPSIHPVAQPKTAKVVAAQVAAFEAEAIFRRGRRAKMQQIGKFLSATKPIASKSIPNSKIATIAKTALTNIAKLAGIEATAKFSTFIVKVPAGAKAVSSAKTSGIATKYHIAFGSSDSTAKKESGADLGLTAVVAKELDGRIIDYRIYQRR